MCVCVRERPSESAADLVEFKSCHFKFIAPPITLPLDSHTCRFSLHRFLPCLTFSRLVFLLRTEWLPWMHLSLWFPPTWKKNSAAVCWPFSCLQSSLCGRRRRKGVTMIPLNCKPRNCRCWGVWRKLPWGLVPSLHLQATPSPALLSSLWAHYYHSS